MAQGSWGAVVLTGAQRELRSAESVPVTSTVAGAGDGDVPVTADRPAVATPRS
jgi:hypothetical protein